MEVNKNTFTSGLNMDISDFVQQNETLTYAKNIRIVDLGSDTFSITNMEGTSIAFTLTSGFIPLASESYNGISYILSHNPNTLQGEIGSYPSPNYIDGNLENTYKPFKNYNGDTSLGVGIYGDFRSVDFNFDLLHPIQAEIQNEYDGTVNIIFTDNKNPIRIINSRFTILPDNKYAIIDREGKDTNLYSRDNFKNIINLVAKSDKILKIAFNGIVEGGRVKVGNYIFYFKYSTQDLNSTEVIGQSFTASVFFGNKVANTRGGKDGEETNKQINFTLSNLDQAYRYLKVSFVISTGTVDVVKNAYSIDVNYPILGDSLDFSYTGFENITRIERDTLSVTNTNIDTARTIAQIQGYLMVANIKEKKYDKTSLEEFSKRIIIGSEEKDLDIIGVNSVQEIYNEVIDQTNTIYDGWNGAYYNPRNIYERLGYWGGEAYAFGIVYIFLDGTLSPVFPCIGIDNSSNLNGNKTYTDGEIDQIIADRFNNSTGENSIGVYRFPNRNADSVNDILFNAGDVSTISINGVTFKLPSGTVYTDIKETTIGCFFVRANRIPDVLGQGYIVPTVKAQAFADYQYDHGRTEWNTELESTYKVLPMIKGMIETVRKKSTSGSDVVTNFLFKFQKLMTSGRRPVDQKRYGFYSNDSFITNEKSISTYNGRDITLQRLGTVGAVGDVSFVNSLSRSSLSLFRTSAISKGFVGDNVNAQSYWTVGDFEGRNSGLFSSLEFNLEGKRNNEKFLLWAAWNDYIGIVLKELSTLDPGDILSNSVGGQTQSGVVLNETGDYINTNEIISYLTNIYTDGGQKTTTQVGNVYNNIDSFQYFPISERLYWNEIEAQMSIDRKVTFYNGDCFIGLGHRIQYFNKELDQSANADYDNINIGNAVTILNEGNHNIALRNEEVINTNTLATASFMPYIENSNGNYSVFRQRKYRYPETKGYLKGFSEVKGDKQYIVIPQGVPYIASNWFTRIIASERHIPNSFENGYRKFLGLNFQDYDTAYGQIVRICNSNGLLVCIQEHGVSIIPVNERTLVGGDTSGSVFVQSTKVLSDNSKQISEKFGSKHQFGIVVTDNTVYGIDTSAKKIWRLEGDGLKFISDFSISSFLPILTNYDNRQINVGTIGIIGTLDKRYDEVIFTFYHPTSNNSFTIVYNEAIGKFTCFCDFIPISYGALNDTIYSFSGGNFHEHNKNILRSNFYGVQKDAVIEFVVSTRIDLVKVFDYLNIISNEICPDRIDFSTQNQSATLLKGYDPILDDDIIKYKEKKFVLTIPESTILVDTNELLEWADEARFRDEFIKIRITYSSNEKIRVNNVNTFYRYSKS